MEEKNLELKQALSLVFNLTAKVEEVTKDGWQWFQDSVALIPSLTKIPSIIKNSGDIWEQFLCLTPQERDELNEWAKENFNLENDTVESIIENIFDIIRDISQLYFQIKDIKK